VLAALCLVGNLSLLAGGGPRRLETNRPPTRLEILRGALTPLRTCYDVTSYHLDIRVDPAAKFIKGSNRIGFKAVEDFEKLQLDLFTNLTIEKIVFDDGAEAAFTRELSAVYVQLPATARKDSTHNLMVYYSGSPITARRPPWDGGFTWTNDASGNPWVVVTCEGTGASLWWPNKDHPTGKPGDVSISITVPPGLEDVSNGRLLATNQLPDGWTRYDWHVSYPINNYDVTLNIGKFAHFGEKYASKVGPPLTLDYYVMPENLVKAKKQFQQVKLMLGAYEKYFGPYPFPRDGYKLIECPHTGMEHQSAVAYGNHWLGGYRGNAPSAEGLKFDFIIIHESAHEWWGNNVSCSDHADMWLHESFGAYAESLFVEDQYGRDKALKYINGKRFNVRNDRPIIGQYGLNREGSGDMYDKGQLVLNTLRDVIDDDPRWFSILHGLQQTYSHQAISATNVFDYIREHAGKDLTGFFEEYFQHTNVPKLIVMTQQTGDGATVRYRWQVDVPDFRMPIKVTLHPGKYEFIVPTTSWQTNTLHGVAPEDFKIADDLFFVDSSLRWSYHDPNQAAVERR
jgi:aminopeptidase N